MNLEGKVAWISGGARMGSAVAQVLVDAGCRIVLTWRKSRSSAEATIRNLSGPNVEAMSVQCDLTRAASIQSAINAVQRRFGRLDVVVDLASIYESTPRPVADSIASWKENMDANAQSAYLLGLTTAPFLARSGQGRLIFISDWTSASGRPRYAEYDAYYVSKLAVKGVVEALALRLAPKVLVNGIAPGPMLPPAGMSARERKAVEKATPLGRWGGADAMAATVRFLAETDFITGETVRLDGGRHLI